MRRWWWAACLIVVLSGCLFARKMPVLPSKNSTDRGQLVVHSDFDLPNRHRLLEELNLVREDVHRKLALRPSDESVNVYLFESGERFREYLEERHPGLPPRRAFFLETDTELIVYAHWSEQVAEDLRHEVTHGYLHAVVPNIPLWLDEGLAEYFEVPRDHRGYHRPHIELLMRLYKRDEWTPDLHRLEKLQSLDEMTLLDYAEAWLWAHLLMETAPERLDWLRRYVAQIEDHQQPESLSKVLAQAELSPERTLIQHLKWLDENPLR